ncbi:unnamed protein product [Dibothriocephalus latus]|uniref:Bestrophin homolog n=1 Tax=Dibothriocephalus latus TaxID=60516 RepID=A0A3P7LBJ5_DIBLA|nr:unnamed protein product [Dibothriocephalus latus]
MYCNKVSERMPIGLFLGFYVNIVVGQWWGRFCAIPWPDSVVLAICAYIQGDSKSLTARRHTLIRYVHLTYILHMRGMSSRVKQQYPTIEHVVTAGIMTEQEKDLFLQSGDDGKSGIAFLPIMWAVNLINQLRTEGAIPNATSLELLQEELRNFRGGFGVVWTYNYLSVPLAYTQISLIIIYSYFGLSIFAWQPLNATQNYIGHNINVYVPVFGLLQLAFYIGWSKYPVKELLKIVLRARDSSLYQYQYI